MPRRFRSGAPSRPRRLEAWDLIWAKRGIWVYFWLLILEGALRKWVVPQLSGPLLLVRDPVVLWVCWRAFRAGAVPLAALGPVFLVGVPITLLAGVQVAAGIDTPLIALYGIRSYVLHLTIAVITARIFTFEDVKQMGKWILVASIPIVIIMAVQYRAPAGSWWNAGVGNSSGQITSAGGHVRASGPFSFITGACSFVGLAQAFLLFGLIQPGTYPRWLTVPSTIALIVAIPLSGSRTLLFDTVGLLAFALFAAIDRPGKFQNFTKVIVVSMLVGLAALQVPIVRQATDTFTERWRNASGPEGDVVDSISTRFLGDFGQAFELATNTALLGSGVGMGSNAAAYLTTGSQNFLLAEGEWSRVVLEFGPALGLGFLFLRVFVAYELLVLARRGSVLSWFLVSVTVPSLILGSMEQPTSLGFIVLGTGLCVASGRARQLRRRRRSLKTAPSREVLPQYAVSPACNY